MKRISGIFALMIGILVASCDGVHKTKPNAVGRAFELVVVSDRSIWEGPVGDTLRSILLEPVPMTNQREPLMDLVPILPGGFTSVMERHRNVMIVQVGPEFAEPQIGVQNDVYAEPQLIVQVTGPNTASVARYLEDHREEVAHVFAMAERERYVSYATSQAEKKISERIDEKFGFDMSIPKGYTLRNDLQDFLWISLELPQVSQGIVIYSYPYQSQADLTLDSLVSKRNRFVSLIPGPADGSYMKTADIEPELVYKRIYGRLWVEMRGFWDVKGDFMGGPFVSYTTVDAATRQVICIDNYLYSPRHNKRNYLRELENLIYTVRFDGDQLPTLEDKE